MSNNYLVLVLVSIIYLSQLAPFLIVSAQPLYGGTLVVASSGDPSHLNTAITGDTTIEIIARNIFESLVIASPQLEIKPSLAESWDISTDGLTFTFHLVQNATWHDGHPFTAEDVVFNIESVGPVFDSTMKSTFKNLESVEALDNHTIRVKFASPSPGFLYFVAYKFKVVPKHLYEGTDISTNPYNLEPVGTGPFKFKEWVRGSHITLERNENYWKKGKPYLDKIVYKIIPDAAARALAAEKGEVDYLPFYGFPFQSAISINNAPHMKVEDKVDEQGYSTLLEFIVNLRDNSILQDKQVRKALAYAIDRQFIVQTGFYGYGKVATSSCPSSIPWAYNPDNPYAQIAYNSTMANELLDDAGYPKDGSGMRFTLDLVYDKGLFEFVKAAEVIKENFKALGVEVELRPSDRAGYTSAYKNWDYDTFLGRAGQGPDPSRNARQYVSSSIVPSPSLNYNAGYNNSMIDELYDLAAAEADEAQRAEYYYDIQDILGEDVPIIHLVEVGYPIAYNLNFKNIIKGAFLQEEMDNTYWTEGYDVSPESAKAAIEEAEETLESLQNQWYDVAAALEKLDEAKYYYDQGDYYTAFAFSQDALALATPPYYLYAIIAVVIAVPVVAGIYIYMRRKRKT